MGVPSQRISLQAAFGGHQVDQDPRLFLAARDIFQRGIRLDGGVPVQEEDLAVIRTLDGEQMGEDAPQAAAVFAVIADGAHLGEAGAATRPLIGIFFIEIKSDLVFVANLEGLDDVFKLFAADDDARGDEDMGGEVAVG